MVKVKAKGKDDGLTPVQRREATVWRILRQAYLRVVCEYAGRNPASVSHEEANALLERWFPAMECDLAMIAECMTQSKLEGIETVHHKLHGEPAVDDEMLDQAVEYAKKPVGEMKAVDTDE